MNSHKHAGLTVRGRVLLVNRVIEQGWKVACASEAAGVSERTGYKWLARFKAEGNAGLADRSSRPRNCPHATSPDDRQRFEQLRLQRWPLWRIARQCGRSLATLSRCMKQAGLSRLKALEPPEPVVRYERENPGERLHIDTKHPRPMGRRSASCRPVCESGPVFPTGNVEGNARQKRYRSQRLCPSMG
jgi:transposase